MFLAFRAIFYLHIHTFWVSVDSYELILDHFWVVSGKQFKLNLIEWCCFIVMNLYNGGTENKGSIKAQLNKINQSDPLNSGALLAFWQLSINPMFCVETSVAEKLPLQKTTLS